jgi:hypothetical protein
MSSERCRFEVAGGSAPGRGHVRAGRNNQDAYRWRMAGGVLIGVVCDGCSASSRSEVGAQLGASLITEALLAALTTGVELPAAEILESTRRSVLEQIAALARAMGGPTAEVVTEFFLFTAIGFFLTPLRGGLFAIGDGLVVLNGERLSLGPYPANAPPYLAHALLDPRREDQRFDILRRFSPEEMRSIFIGTDGVLDLEAAADRRLPGREETVGPLSKLWTDDRCFFNPDHVRRHLAQINREVTRRGADGVLRRESGLLPDDTTLIVVRRREERQEADEAERGKQDRTGAS